MAYATTDMQRLVDNITKLQKKIEDVEAAKERTPVQETDLGRWVTQLVQYEGELKEARKELKEAKEQQMQRLVDNITMLQKKIIDVEAAKERTPVQQNDLERWCTQLLQYEGELKALAGRADLKRKRTSLGPYAT